MKLRHSFLSLILLLTGAATLAAQGSYVATDRFGYSGTINRYTSYADAAAGTNAVSGSPFAVPARDVALYWIDNNASLFGPAYTNFHMFGSHWSANGGSSPSNVNPGFVQLYDWEGGSVTLSRGYWTDASMTTFALTATGGNTVPGCTGTVADCGRLWDAGSDGGPSSATGGVFSSYTLSFLASGLAPAIWNPTTLAYESVSQPTGVTGSFTGIFQNTSTTHPGSHGWYAFDLQLSLDSWAHANGYGEESAFGSAEVAPEPATMTLLATGLAGVMAARRKRRQA